MRKAASAASAALMPSTSAGCCFFCFCCLCWNQTRRCGRYIKPQGNRDCFHVCVRSMAEWEKNLWRLSSTGSNARDHGCSLPFPLLPRFFSAAWDSVCFVCIQWRIQTGSLSISISLSVSVSISETLPNQHPSLFSNRQYSIHKWNIVFCLSCSCLFHFYYRKLQILL